MSDPNWNNGFYYDGVPPHVGMKLARRRSWLSVSCTSTHSAAEIATITYRSGPEWDQRFGRQMRKDMPEATDTRQGGPRTPLLCPDFMIETYLDHQVRTTSV